MNLFGGTVGIKGDINPLRGRRQLFVGMLAGALVCGCTSSPPPAPPVQVVNGPPPVVAAGKPLPDPGSSTDLNPGFDDPAILHQQLPETPAFLNAYNRVDRPRIMVFVNRTLTGDLIPVNPDTPAVSMQNTQQATGSVRVNSDSNSYGYYSGYTNSSRSFESNGPGSYTNKTDIYLQPGQYDEAQAKSVDYELIENLIADNLSADGKVVMISPLVARQGLSDQDFSALQSGKPQMLGELAGKLQADVLVQITARPSVQTDQGLGIRLIAQAFNTKGGQSIANAAVDVPPPLIKTKLNAYSRFVARKLMDGMTQSWITMADQAPPAQPAVKPNDAFPPGAQGKATTLPATLPNQYDGAKQ
jgi:hypothetical protein